MNKFKLFVENFLVYGLGGIISKIVPLIMVPIVTRLIPNSAYFGISDMSNTIVSFATSLAIMGMYDAMYRLYFEKEDDEYKKDICSTAFIFTMSTSILIFLIMVIFCRNLAQFFMGDNEYANIIYITAIATLVGSTNSIISAPTRMQNKRKIYLITNTISPILSYSISISLLLNGYYLIALPIAGVIASAVMGISFWILNKQWFSIKRFDYRLLKQLLWIGIPLLPNFLIYWVFNSSDRVMITNFIGITAVGIYSVASKLGHCSQLIYTAFSGGWQYFAFSTMKEENQVKSNSMIFEYLGVISFIATMFVCAGSKIIFEVLFPEQYISGYIVAPYLFLAPLLQMLFQVAGNQFLVIKKTWPTMFILLAGAVCNVIMNYFFIPIIGMEGAALATLIGYVVSNVICVSVLYHKRLISIRKRFFVALSLMVIYMVLWRLVFLNDFTISICIALIISGLLCVLYKQDIGLIFHKHK